MTIIESKIDEIMKAKDISIDDLIKKTDLPRMTIFNARKGANVTLTTALKISEALDVTVEEIWLTDSTEQDTTDADVSSL